MGAPTVKMLNGSNIPVIGLGTWQVGSDGNEFENALNAALESGYRHIDTAFSYRNEHVIGKVLQEWFSSGKLKREDIFVTTKLPTEGIHPDRVDTYMKKSLASLQLDYVDLYLIHFTVPTTPKTDPKEPIKTESVDHVAVWKKMEEQVEAGRSKAIGISNFNIQQIDRILNDSKIKPACLQIENHIFLPQNELVTFAQDNGIVVVAYSPLANPSYNKFLERFGLPPREIPSILTHPTIKGVADKHKKSTAQIALKFLLQRNVVVIPKSVTVNRLKQNIDLFDFNLDAQDMAALRNLEIGEDSRVCDFTFSKAFTEHPEYPFPLPRS